MANEFVARRGIIAQSGGAKITGSLLVSGTIDATGYNIIATSLTGSFSGSIGTATTASYVLPSGLPAGTVSASSQVDYNSIQNKLSGVISSSAQFNALSGTSASFATTASFALNATIPAGTVSSSTQFKTLTDPFTGSFTGSFTGDGSGLTGIATSLGITGSTGTATVNLKTQGLTINGGNGITTNATGQSVTVSAPAGTVSASSQIDYNSIQNKLSGVVSSSAQVAPLLPGGTVSSSAQYPGWVTASSQIVVQNTTGIGALATTGSNVFTANQVITGSLFISQNLTVLGSSSISYISQSTLNIGTNVITVNTNTPGTRFGGLEVIDSGSSPLRSGSLYFDSINDQWIFVHQNTAGGVTSSVLLMGPSTFNNVGNETLITQNRILKGAGLEHITDSQITDNGITVSITNGLSAGSTITASAFTATTTSSLAAVYSSSAQAVAAIAGQTIAPTTVNATSILSSSVLQTGNHALVGGKLAVTGALEVTGTVTASNLTANQAVFTNGSDGLVSNAITGTGNVVMSASPTLTGTLTAANITANGTILLQGIYSSSTQVDYNSIQNKLSGVVSSSAQVQPLLPGGTVSSSAQYPGWVTASSQIALASITGTTFAASNFTFPQQLTVSGVLSGSTSAYLNNTLYSGSTVTGIVGPVTNQVVASVATGSFTAAHFDYTINDGTNYRTGTVMSVWSPSTVEYTDTSTNDIGNTAQASFVVDAVSGVARLKFTNLSGTWTVKTAVRAL